MRRQKSREQKRGGSGASELSPTYDTSTRARTGKPWGLNSHEVAADGNCFCWLVVVCLGGDCVGKETGLRDVVCRFGDADGSGLLRANETGPFGADGAGAPHRPLFAPPCSPFGGESCMSLAVHQHQRNAASRSPPRTDLLCHGLYTLVFMIFFGLQFIYVPSWKLVPSR